MRKGLSLGSLPQIFYLIMLIGAFAGATYIFLDAYQDVTREDTAVANESINFVANNTYYDITNTPVRTGWVLYDNETHTNVIPSSFYGVNPTIPTEIRVYTNGTGGWPNITTGVHYLAYTYGASTPASTGLGYVVTFVDNITENLGTLGVIIFIVLLVSTVMLLQRYNKRSGGA